MVHPPCSCLGSQHSILFSKGLPLRETERESKRYGEEGAAGIRAMAGRGDKQQVRGRQAPRHEPARGHPHYACSPQKEVRLLPRQRRRRRPRGRDRPRAQI